DDEDRAGARRVCAERADIRRIPSAHRAPGHSIPASESVHDDAAGPGERPARVERGPGTVVIGLEREDEPLARRTLHAGHERVRRAVPARDPGPVLAVDGAERSADVELLSGAVVEDLQVEDVPVRG